MKKNQMPEDIGYSLACHCCPGLLVARDGNGEQFYQVFTSEAIAKLKASDQSDEIGKPPKVVKVKIVRV